MCVIPILPHPPLMGRNTSGNSSTNACCCSNVSITFPYPSFADARVAKILPSTRKSAAPICELSSAPGRLNAIRRKSCISMPPFLFFDSLFTWSSRTTECRDGANLCQKAQIINRLPNLDALPSRKQMNNLPGNDDHFLRGRDSHELTLMRSIERVAVSDFLVIRNQIFGRGPCIWKRFPQIPKVLLQSRDTRFEAPETMKDHGFVVHVE